MELDKRIIECKKPLTCFDVEIAKQFIGKKGYFSHYIDNYADLKYTALGILGSTGDTYHESYCCIDESCDNYYYEFFIPSEWVKEPEKIYRPYTLAEWIEQHEIGEVIHYRSKSEGIELRHMYMGYAFGRGNDITKINVGTVTLDSFDYLFEDYEIEIDGKWQPFGVIDE